MRNKGFLYTLVEQKVIQEAQPEEEIKIGELSALSNMHWIFSVESYLRSLELDWKTQKSVSQKFASQLLGWIKGLFHFGYVYKNNNKHVGGYCTFLYIKFKF